MSAAFLHHYLYAAREGRRIVADFVDPSALAALAGFAAVANPYGVETCSRMAQPPVQWPCAPVRFSPALAISPSDLVLTIRDGAVCARVGRREVVSTKLAPAFNPLLARRLLRVWLTLQSEGATAIAIYGAGSHTDEVLQWGLPAGIALKGIVTTPIAGVAPADVDGVVISSATYEMEMCDAARALGFRALPIYSGWPRPFWTVAPAAGLAAACA